jgi:hypothetical protein
MTFRGLAGTALTSAAMALALTAVLPVATAAAEDHGDGTGWDISHPQCGTRLPTAPDFAVVGVNGGLASAANPCLAGQLAWAAGSGAVPGQPDLQLYLNTADPGQLRDQVSTWPSTGGTPYGGCDGGNSRACSWQYGWQRAAQSVSAFFAPAAQAAEVDGDPARYTWWLDVETANTWQSGSAGQARNRAALEGMAAYLSTRGARVGVYSTGRQWEQVVGDVPPDSTLTGLPSWVAGASSAEEARDACAGDPLVPGGDVVLAQYVTASVDADIRCS